MLFGTPNVTTKIGAEAMHDNLDWNGFIADNPEEFAKKAIDLYTNQGIWKQAQENGVTIINKCFNKNNFEDNFSKRIGALIENIEFHRQSNFMGQLLNYHTLKSIMYMSKWIEEKNSKK